MRIISVAVFGLVLTGLVFGEAQYMGAEKCARMCHKAVSKGEQLKIWQASKHANAYAELATPKALETAKKAGITGDPQKADKCVKCHVTGFGLPASRFDSTFSMKDGVQCEACHGAGSDYAKLKIMKDKKLAIAAGLTIPTEKVCVKCHNTESPFYKPFVFADMEKKIAHPRPKTAADSAAAK
jgi:Cytochrome c554 and c-prime